MFKERLAGNKFKEICVCVSPTQAKMYAIKPKIPETYYQPDALYLCWTNRDFSFRTGRRFRAAYVEVAEVHLESGVFITLL